MKDFFKFFKIPLVIFAAVAVAFTGITVIRVLSHQYTRENTSCTETGRVFDYANVLTDEEEANLEALIKTSEDKVGCDIIIVTMNESLEYYAKQYDENAYGSDYAMIFADNFYDEHCFGYNRAYGDGVLFLDNKYREATGKVYDWMSTSGRAETKYSSAMIDDILYATEDYIDTNDYKAYTTFVKQFTKDMSSQPSAGTVGLFIPFVISVIIAGIFLVVNIVPKKGKKTTTARTFLGEQKMNENTDVFLRKTVTQRRIETSSGGGGSHGGGGGGGHHTSSGGHSHGGGGHSR